MISQASPLTFTVNWTDFGDLLKLLTDFLSNRKQRVVLNGQVSTWTSINAGVPQGSILSPLLFLIYINDLSDNLSSNVKLFADDTSLFSVIHDINISAGELNEDLKKISEWAFQWKMIFNPDATKQAQEVIFSRKIKKTLILLWFSTMLLCLKLTHKNTWELP